MVSDNLADYTIRLGNAAQEEQHLRAAFAEWARGRSWEEYMEDRRQCVVGKDSPWADNGGLKMWVLVRRDDFDGPIRSGCATFRRDSFYKNPTTGDVKDGFSYGISMVVTPKEHRGQGFATRCLQLLHYQLGPPSSLPPFPTAEWGAPPPPLSPADQAALPSAQASILFSAVGSKFYERVTIGTQLPGWIVRDEECQAISWKLAVPPTGLEQEKQSWDWIYTRDLPSIAKVLSVAAKKQVAQADDQAMPVWATDPASPGVLGYVPSLTLRPQSADWRHVYDTEPCGIHFAATTPGQEDAIVLFTTSLGEIRKAVLITYIHRLDVQQLPMLVEALDQVGARLGLEEGWVWGNAPDGPFGRAWAGMAGRVIKAGRRDELEGCLLGMAWYESPESRAEIADTQMWSWC